MDAWGVVLHTYSDRPLFQTPAWIRFIAESQGAQPVVAVLKDRERTVGHFAGLLVRYAGFKVLGSPLPGWTTSYMGMRLLPEVARREALTALVRFAFQELRCAHLEVMDRNWSLGDGEGIFSEHRSLNSFEVDLQPPVDKMFLNMSSGCRRHIRKAERAGVVIEECCDESFVDDYYRQLEDVFARQSLVPTYSVERIRLLIRHLMPTGNLLLLRARDPSGRCIATGIFPAMNDRMYFFGGGKLEERPGFLPERTDPLARHAVLETARNRCLRYGRGRRV